jgi:glycosyltransferase A (GT-A) superfamily protein (DUF2064 family)
LLSDKDVLWVEQQGQDLGIKLQSAINCAEKIGFSPVITIGADSPTLPPDYLQTAITLLCLKTSEIVLGPTTDGGFYLVGLQKSVSNLFDNVSWSTSSVYQQTSDNAKKIGLSKLFKLPVWYDVDTPHDLLFLRAQLLGNEEIQLRAPKTYQWLQSNSSLFL